MKTKRNNHSFGRRDFIRKAGIGAGTCLLGLHQARGHLAGSNASPPIQGFEDHGSGSGESKIWIPVSSRKIRVGLVGYGVCRFAAAFGFQDHPNVDVAAVSDLIPERCQKLAEVTKCSKT
ncbi:MAG: twin-arginine translocation signal domain-containing protein, partial [Proteiniphilum sp.]|nr:twin-arginine translocation signal domain-containing protein [Proteiniphilum sp.]